jgi:hypothetical protein
LKRNGKNLLVDIDGRDYPWGEAMGYQNDYANTCDFVIGRTSSVTEFELGDISFWML